MLNIGDVYEIDTFLTESEREIVDNEFENPSWELKGGELALRSHGIPIKSFLYKELQGTKIEDLFKSKVEGILNTKIKTSRIYGNGQAHGQCGFLHYDDNDANSLSGSLVYYVHKQWPPFFGGHLIFTENDTVVKSVFPYPNSAVLFNSAMQHCPLEPTIYCLDMRISIAYKFKVIE